MSYCPLHLVVRSLLFEHYPIRLNIKICLGSPHYDEMVFQFQFLTALQVMSIAMCAVRANVFLITAVQL